MSVTNCVVDDSMEIEAKLRDLGCHSISKKREVGGGCVNDAYEYDTDNGKFFVKVNTEQDISVFESEAEGLKAMKETNSVIVPSPLAAGTLNGGSFLIMEYIDFSSKYSAIASKKLGEKLAAMHMYHNNKQTKFGFHVNNMIGGMPQVNDWSDNWAMFYKENRIRAQLKLVSTNHPSDKELPRLGNEFLDSDNYDKLFDGIEIKPSLIHGDLWGGNYSADEDGNPILYDPAAYFGHNEAELGMMRLFGSPPVEFWDEYHSHIPKSKNYESLCHLYQLYHYINHYNMFGSGYRSQCISILKRLCK